MAANRDMSRRLWAVLLVVLLAAGFVTRIHYPVSRPYQWLVRALAFNDAVDEQDWANTYQRYHPGLTTMAIGGASIHLYHKSLNSTAFPFTALQALFEWSVPSYASRYGREMAAGVIGLAAVMTLLIGLSALVMARLGSRTAGLAAAGLLAFSPYYLSQSQVFHVDALLSTLMLLSALLILLYLRSGRWLHLALSGLVGGLALLTKTPALYLVPYAGLALGVGLLGRLREGWDAHPADRVRWLAAEAGRWLVLPLVVWLVIAALPFALWPAMWVRPVYVLDQMYGSIARHASNTHPRTRFFAGRLYAPGEPPNRLFYLAVIVFNASFVSLTLVIVAILYYALRRLRRDRPLLGQTFWLLMAYVFFFVLQMTIGDKQDQRYILPAFLMLDVIAGVGFAGLVGTMRRVLAGRRAVWAAGALSAVALTVHAVSTVAYAPAYGAYHNPLLGGNPVAQQVLELADQNEGILEIGAYLADHATSGEDTVGVPLRLYLSLRQYFPRSEMLDMDPGADFYVFSAEQRQRSIDLDEWAGAWIRLGDQQPVLSVRFDGVEYLSLYAADPARDLPHQVIDRGGSWLIVLAWVWTIALTGCIVWMLRAAASSPVDSEAIGQPA